MSIGSWCSTWVRAWGCSGSLWSIGVTDRRCSRSRVIMGPTAVGSVSVSGPGVLPLNLVETPFHLLSASRRDGLAITTSGFECVSADDLPRSMDDVYYSRGFVFDAWARLPLSCGLSRASAIGRSLVVCGHVMVLVIEDEKERIVENRAWSVVPGPLILYYVE